MISLDDEKGIPTELFARSLVFPENGWSASWGINNWELIVFLVHFSVLWSAEKDADSPMDAVTADDKKVSEDFTQIQLKDSVN